MFQQEAQEKVNKRRHKQIHSLDHFPSLYQVMLFSWRIKAFIFNHNIRVCNFYHTRLLQNLGLSTHNILVPCDLVLDLKLRSQDTQSNWCHDREQGLKTSYQCKNSSIILNNVTFFLQDESLVLGCHSFLRLLSLIMSETEKKTLGTKVWQLGPATIYLEQEKFEVKKMKKKTMGMKKQKTKGSNLRSKLLQRSDLGVPKEEKHILACKRKGSRQNKWSCKFNHLVNIFLGTRSIDQRKFWEDK